MKNKNHKNQTLLKRSSFSNMLENQIYNALKNNEYEEPTPEPCPEPTPEPCPEPTPEPCPEFIILSKQQMKIYECLASWGKSGFTSARKLELSTGISKNYIYKILSKLRRLRIVSYKRVNTIHKGFNYTLRKKRKSIIPFDKDNISFVNLNFNSTLSKNNCLEHQSHVQSQHQDSSFLNKLLLRNNYEIIYWKEKGLTEKQIQELIVMVKCTEEAMLNFLSYCHFEMVDLGLEESKPVENVLNWFYKIIERTGGYPKPKGYKSFEEKRLDEERERVAEKERIAKEQKEIYERKIKAERDADFYEMMNNPESEMYLKCFEKLNKFTKKRKGTKAFEMGMRGAYDEIVEAQ